jgi:phosphatidylinositol kinase/protein kinase (PI-3  family)
MPLMDKLSQLWRRLLFYARRDQFDSELEEEMRFHLELKAQDSGYSYLSATNGSTRDARHAGSKHAIAATSVIVAIAVAIVGMSDG